MLGADVIAAIEFRSPTAPAHGSARNTVALDACRRGGTRGARSPLPKTAPRAPISIGSPSAVPVPCISTT